MCATVEVGAGCLNILRTFCHPTPSRDKQRWPGLRDETREAHLRGPRLARDVARLHQHNLHIGVLRWVAAGQRTVHRLALSTKRKQWGTSEQVSKQGITRAVASPLRVNRHNRHHHPETRTRRLLPPPPCGSSSTEAFSSTAVEPAPRLSWLDTR